MSDSSHTPHAPRFHIVLFEPEIPGNTGAIGRTCVGLQAKLWLVRPLGFKTDEKTLRRAGLDYWAHLDWEIVDNWDALMQKLANHNFWYFSKTATRSFWDVSFAKEDVLVFGSETAGLPPRILQLDPPANLQIPISADVRSLNLATAAAVAGYEVTRQLVLLG